jgi:hypothetical protein
MFTGKMQQQKSRFFLFIFFLKKESKEQQKPKLRKGTKVAKHIRLNRETNQNGEEEQ